MPSFAAAGKLSGDDGASARKIERRRRSAAENEPLVLDAGFSQETTDWDWREGVKRQPDSAGATGAPASMNAFRSSASPSEERLVVGDDDVPFSSRFCVVTRFSTIGIVDPARVPNPTVMTLSPISRARRASARTSSALSKPSPSLMRTIALSP